MPVTIRTANLKYKNTRGEYVGVNTVGDYSTQEQLAAIAAKGEEVLESIPPDYSALSASVSGKADRASPAVNGNFAALDANGNLTDSGKKHSDYLPAGTIDDTAGTGDADKVWSADRTSRAVAEAHGAEVVRLI